MNEVLVKRINGKDPAPDGRIRCSQIRHLTIRMTYNSTSAWAEDRQENVLDTDKMNKKIASPFGYAQNRLKSSAFCCIIQRKNAVYFGGLETGKYPGHETSDIEMRPIIRPKTRFVWTENRVRPFDRFRLGTTDSVEF